jgi:hypothetical protein
MQDHRAVSLEHIMKDERDVRRWLIPFGAGVVLFVTLLLLSLLLRRS